MTTRHILLTLSLVVTTAPLFACSRQPSASVASASLAQSTPAGQSPVKGLDTSDSRKLAADYKQRCAAEETPSDDCEILRSLLVAEVSTALDVIERSKDQRGVQHALAALDVLDEPDVLIPALRILGRFKDTPAPTAKVFPLLLRSRYIEVQRAAAQLLTVNPDPGVEELGRLWLNTHGELKPGDTYDEYPDFPAHLDKMGFPEYPGAEWFSPGDSDRSIGWSTPDAADVVARWFGEKLGTEVLEAQKWAAVQNEQTLRATTAILDQTKMARMQQLAEKAVKGDQAAIAEMDKLQKEIEQAGKNADQALKKSVADAANPSPSGAAHARWIVAEKKDGRVSKLVLVYPLAGLQRTVIRTIWDLTDYPSAWPEEKK